MLRHSVPSTLQFFATPSPLRHSAPSDAYSAPPLRSFPLPISSLLTHYLHYNTCLAGRLGKSRLENLPAIAKAHGAPTKCVFNRVYVLQPGSIATFSSPSKTTTSISLNRLDIRERQLASARGNPWLFPAQFPSAPWKWALIDKFYKHPQLHLYRVYNSQRY